MEHPAPERSPFVEVRLKPARSAAVWLPMATSALWLVLIGGGIAVAALVGDVAVVALVALVVAGGLLGLSWLNLEARYRKSEFRILDDRFIARTGTLFSDTTSELAVRNVTFVNYELPFFERMFLGTGTVRVESAGSGGCEVDMFCLAEPLAVLDQVLAALRRNGFRMKMGTPIQEHQVATSGVVVDILGRFIGYLFVGFYLLASVFSEKGHPDLVVIAVLSCLGLLLCLVVLTVRFLDLHSRRYRLYSDGVDFEEGYFTKRRVFIPAENVADTRVDQGLFSRIFSYFDVKVSCQGAGKEITFAYLSEGRRMMEGIDAAVEETRARDARGKEAPESGGAAADGADAADGGDAPRAAGRPVRSTDAEDFRGDRTWTGDFKQRTTRALVPAACTIAFGVVAGGAALGGVMLLAPEEGMVAAGMAGAVVFGGCALLAVVSAVSLWIGAAMTSYRVGEDSFLENFEFIVKKRKEFSCDKVTSVTFERNPFDTWFGTVTTKVTTIGSAEILALRHLDDSDDFEEHVLAKIGLSLEKPLSVVTPTWSLGNFLRAPAVLPVFGSLTVLLAGAVVAVWLAAEAVDRVLVGVLVGGTGLSLSGILGLAVFWSRLSTSVCRLDFASEHLICRHGVIFREQVFVPYRCVKGLQAHHLLGPSSVASVVIDIAGEIAVGPQGQQGVQPQPGQQQLVKSNSFSMDYVPDARWFLDGLDLVIASPVGRREVARRMTPGEARPDGAVLLEGRPHMLQLLIGRFIAVLFFAALVFGGFVAADAPLVGALVAAVLFVALVALSAYQSGFIHYYVEDLRVSLDWGLFWRSRKTVCYRHVDFIRDYEGILNKLFGTGTIMVHTTGSSFVELSFDALPGHGTFEAEIKKHY